MADAELIGILNTMDLPVTRKNLAVEANLRWLVRNIGIRNLNNPQIDKAMTLILNKLNITR